MAKLIDGKLISAQIRAEIKEAYPTAFTVYELVMGIIFWSSVVKVAYIVVHGVVVFMADEHTVRAWPDKVKRNELVDGVILSVKVYSRVTRCGVPLEGFLSFYGEHLAVIVNEIFGMPLNLYPLNLYPFLFRHNRCLSLQFLLGFPTHNRRS